MVIQIKHNSKVYFIQAKQKRKQPTITPYKNKAWHFEDLSKCTNVRDDVLEYFPGAVVTG